MLSYTYVHSLVFITNVIAQYTVMGHLKLQQSILAFVKCATVKGDSCILYFTFRVYDSFITVQTDKYTQFVRITIMLQQLNS
jgi:hypothetical protein